MPNTKPIGVAYEDQQLDGAIMGKSGGTAGFFGATATTKPASADQAALTLTTAVSGGYGFGSATAFNAAVAQLENIRASLVTLGLLKGSA